MSYFNEGMNSNNQVTNSDASRTITCKCYIYDNSIKCVVPVPSNLECVFLKDYDNFIDEYLINFIDVKNREEAKKQIITLGLQYYFNVNKINKNSYVEQYIYDSKTNQKLATINNINNNKKKEIEEKCIKSYYKLL